MPWHTEKRGDRWAIVRSDTGEVVGWSESAEAARASVRARYAAVDQQDAMLSEWKKAHGGG